MVTVDFAQTELLIHPEMVALCHPIAGWAPRPMCHTLFGQTPCTCGIFARWWWGVN
jgi:hypothetical protein